MELEAGVVVGITPFVSSFVPAHDALKGGSVYFYRDGCFAE